MGLWHAVTHRHKQWTKEDVGTLHACGWRWSARPTAIRFRPAFDGAGWQPVPDLETIKRLVGASSAHEAMAILRGKS